MADRVESGRGAMRHRMRGVVVRRTCGTRRTMDRIRVGRREVRRIVCSSLAILAGLYAEPAAAQTCLGQPVGGLAARATVGEIAYVGPAGAVDSGAEVGLGYWANPDGFVAYSAGYARRWAEGGDAHIANIKFGGELPMGGSLPPGAAMCVTAGALGAWFDGSSSRDAWAFPVGLGLGGLFPIGPVSRLHPYVHPAIVLSGAASDGPFTPLLEAGLGFSRASLVARASIASTVQETTAATTAIPDLRISFAAGLRF